MCRSLVDIKWNDPPHAISAFVTVILMPLTYSIAYGLIGGLMTWFSMQAVFFTMKKIFKVERFKAPHKFRELGVHEMKELVKEEENLEALAKSMAPQDKVVTSEDVSKHDTDILETEDIEVASEKK
jgi:AGZA family xanthine/uracil permease-like MFS transporter